jgi:hypothetical protein
MNQFAGDRTPRWDPYLLSKGDEFSKFWQRHFGNRRRKLLYVMGKGFDPRMCRGIEAILKSGRQSVCDCLLVEFDEGPESPSVDYASQVADNVANLKMLLGQQPVITRSIKLWSGTGPDRHRIGSRGAAEIFSNLADVETYTDVAIDVSAIPRGIYYSLIGKLLHILDAEKQRNPQSSVPNLHVIVAENPVLDKNIREVDIDEAAIYVHGFAGDLEMVSTAELPRIWIPILGEAQGIQLDRIYSLVEPDEICPMLPSPSLNPRRGDDLIVEYGEMMFERWRVEPANIIYAAEQNPFEVYRQICRAVLHYNQALNALGGCKTVISAHSGKLLSVGALLSAYELKRAGRSVGLAHVESRGYEIRDIPAGERATNNEDLYNLWLVGECYETS